MIGHVNGRADFSSDDESLDEVLGGSSGKSQMTRDEKIATEERLGVHPDTTLTEKFVIFAIVVVVIVLIAHFGFHRPR